jgi:spore germination protein GerM
MQFYFPNLDMGKIFIKNKEVFFQTNDSTSQVLEEAYKAAIVSNVGEVFTTNTKINSLFLNSDNKVEIDLNSAFLTEMNAGAEYESMILQSLANTFGQYYGVEEVILTIDGKPYASGHIEMQEGESIKVNYENTEEIDV